MTSIADGARRADGQGLQQQLVAARETAAASLALMAERLQHSRSQVARIERHSSAFTPRRLRQYIRAIGPEFDLAVTVHHSITRAEEQSTP
jgi:ribosome-binding protein aMBF1 (putative translation factor)